MVIADKIKDNIYYNTNSDESLWRLDLSTKEKVSLNINNVYGLYPSPDGNQILAKQSDGGGKITLAQRMISYNLKTDVNGRTVSGLYVYDILTGESAQISVDIQSLSTNWSPSGEELIFTEYVEGQYNSSIVYLEYSLSQ